MHASLDEQRADKGTHITYDNDFNIMFRSTKLIYFYNWGKLTARVDKFTERTTFVC